MSRSYRRILNRLNLQTRYQMLTCKGPEACCKPGCGVCLKGPRHRRTFSKKRRAEGKSEINRQLE